MSSWEGIVVTADWNRRALLAALPVALAACTTEEQQRVVEGFLRSAQGGVGPVSSREADQGIRTALIQGIGRAVGEVGQQGGYFSNSLIRIALPDDLARIQSQLAPFGLSSPLDTVEVRMNRAAEAAASGATLIFRNAITSMSIVDALGIVRGGDTAATDYLQTRTTPQLTALYSPLMENALQETGAIQTFDQLVANVRAIPGAPQFARTAKQDLINHAVGGALDGLFYYVSVEEQAIRRDPAGQAQAILRRVFG